MAKDRPAGVDGEEELPAATLLDDLRQAEVEHADAIAAVDPAHRRGAVNLCTT